MGCSIVGKSVTGVNLVGKEVGSSVGKVLGTVDG